ncbi:MAG: AAA family ATPase, partial [Deltaproteobacteria bacterium]|nr:AAA family ATPase [Deltaproteobacteria bacterium]
MKKPPLGISTFQKLIEGGYVYADKTEFIYNLVNTGYPYFLSRPRRFGKSLLLSTFEALFSGPPDPDGPPQGLFKDLWIGQSDYDFTQSYPVITLSMGSVSSKSSIALDDTIIEKLNIISRSEGLDLNITYSSTGLFKLIQNLSDVRKKKVVVLVD